MRTRFFKSEAPSVSRIHIPGLMRVLINSPVFVQAGDSFERSHLITERQITLMIQFSCKTNRVSTIIENGLLLLSFLAVNEKNELITNQKKIKSKSIFNFPSRVE